MTTTVDVPGGRPGGDLGSVLTVLREHAVALAASGPQPPSRVRVEVAGVVVELGWATGEITARPAATGSPTPPVAAPLPVAVPAPEPARNGTAPGAAPVGHRITAPTVGVFYRSPEPGAAPFVQEGDAVETGQQVAIIEAMKLMIPVHADRGGRVAAVLGADAEAVEFGQPLFVLETP